jgi:hypothetical protein
MLWQEAVNLPHSQDSFCIPLVLSAEALAPFVLPIDIFSKNCRHTHLLRSSVQSYQFFLSSYLRLRRYRDGNIVSSSHIYHDIPYFALMSIS